MNGDRKQTEQEAEKNCFLPGEGERERGDVRGRERNCST